MEDYVGKICPFCKTEIKEGDSALPAAFRITKAVGKKTTAAPLLAALSSITRSSTQIRRMCVRIVALRWAMDKPFVQNAVHQRVA